MTDSQEIPGVRISNLEPGLAQVIIEPGIAVPPLGDTTAVNLHVKDGAVRVSISEGTGEVRVASGQPIRSGDGDIILCETGKRELAVGDSAVLAAGNNCFVKDGVLNIAAVGDQPAELHMGATQRSAGASAGGKAQLATQPAGDAQADSEGEAERGKPDKKDGSSGGGGITAYACWVCPGTRP
jgi:hypothetical protein